MRNSDWNAGCTGPIVFNSAGDRSAGTYDFYGFASSNGANAWFELANRAPLTPHAVNASDGVYTDRIRVCWNPVSGATSYTLWGALANDFTKAIQLAQTASNICDVIGAPGNTLCYFWVAASNNFGASAVSSSDSGWMWDGNGPAIMINGMRLAAAVREYWMARHFDAGAARATASRYVIGPICERYLALLDNAVLTRSNG